MLFIRKLEIELTKLNKPLFLLFICIIFFIQMKYIKAQSYPNKPITLIVPTAPGGPIDLTARIISKQ